MNKIEPPTHCPSCGHELDWVNHLLYCNNSSCITKAAKRVEHFAKTMKIKGLGPATVARLKLSDVADIYLMTEEMIADGLNSNKLAEKLFYEIENSKNAPLNLLLPAFSISLVGRSASDKLSFTCESILDINDETCRSAGLGPKVTKNLMNWLDTEFPAIKDLPFSFTFNRQAKPKEIKGIICISGKLKTFKTKAEATKALTDLGYQVKSSITKDVTILVNESGIESAKTRKARDSGTTIVTDLNDLLGD
jgi:NAD-dependent DNA ligase